MRNISLISGGILCNLSSVSAAQSNSKSIINIKKIGAIGDGKADDSDIIDKALQQATKNGKEVHFPPGRYRITRTLKYLVKKDVVIQGSNATLIFDGSLGGTYCLTFYGEKKPLFRLDRDVPAGTITFKSGLPLPDNSILLFEEVEATFKKLDLSLSKIDKVTFKLNVSTDFFIPSMNGKSLVNDRDGVTFLIVSVLDSKNVLVIPGNNQPAQPDFSQYPLWAVSQLWCPSRGYYRKGEFIGVKRIKSGRYRFLKQSYDSYSRNITQVSQVSSGSLEISGLEIDGNQQSYGLNLLNMTNIHINNLSVGNFKVNSLQIDESYSVEVDSSTISVGNNDYPSNYAGCINSSQNVVIGGSRFSGGTHALSHGGTFPCRAIQIKDALFYGSKSWTLDFHGNGQDVNIEKVVAGNGGYIGAVDVNINSSIFNNSSLVQGALVFGSERDSNYYQLTDTKICNSLGDGLVIANQFAIRGIIEINVHSNMIRAAKRAILLQAYPYGKNPFIAKFSLKENKITAPISILNVDNINQFKINK